MNIRNLYGLFVALGNEKGNYLAINERTIFGDFKLNLCNKNNYCQKKFVLVAVVVGNVTTKLLCKK